MCIALMCAVCSVLMCLTAGRRIAVVQDKLGTGLRYYPKGGEVHRPGVWYHSFKLSVRVLAAIHFLVHIILAECVWLAAAVMRAAGLNARLGALCQKG